jgi:hypothetical protein
MHFRKIYKLRKGSVLITAMIFVVVSLIGAGAYMTTSVNEVSLCKKQADSIKAFFLAEAGVERALRDIADGNIQDRTFRISDISSWGNCLDDIDITTTTRRDLENNQYRITSSSLLGASTRVINVNALKEPPAKVFDYAYFINNWGWFYGSGITASGDVRSNGRFDFRYGPRVNGDIYAGQEIGIDGYGIQGKGGQAEHQHPNSPKVEMPNLQDITYYENLARASNGRIVINGTTMIDNVYGDDAGESGNIVLVGTPSNPIEITGPVVVRNDVVIKGTISGQGTIYAGRNIYIADNVNYKNAPPSPRPASEDPGVTDGWVEANRDKDLVGLAARENIVIGDYTKTSHYGYSGRDPWYADYYIFNMGTEDVGIDGIPDTYDQGENDGIFETAYEDLDGDGTFDGNYTWSDIETSVPITQFSNLPDGTSSFSDIATNSLNRLDGILYTNHAVPARVGNGVQINGALISKDEAIIYRNTITFNYDERINSRYRTNPNWLIDLKLPLANKAKVTRWWE